MGDCLGFGLFSVFYFLAQTRAPTSYTSTKKALMPILSLVASADCPGNGDIQVIDIMYSNSHEGLFILF